MMISIILSSRYKLIVWDIDLYLTPVLDRIHDLDLYLFYFNVKIMVNKSCCVWPTRVFFTYYHQQKEKYEF